MTPACASSRAQSDTSRRAASTQLMAVPQAPAPSTAAFFISVARDFDARLLRRRVLLLVERFERERRQDYRREAAPRDHVLDGLAQIRVDHRPTGDAEERSHLLRRDAADLEDAGLARLSQEERALA